MYLNDIKEIRQWISLHTNLMLNQYKIENINNQLVVNTIAPVVLRYDCDGEIKIKFNNINSNFYVNKSYNDLLDSSVYNFNGFPESIQGSLTTKNIPYDNSNGWNVKYIRDSINFCGNETKLENLNFLKDTDFQFVYLRISDTPFKDNVIPDIYGNAFITREQRRTKEQILESIGIYNQKNKEIKDFFSFDNELNKNLEI